MLPLASFLLAKPGRMNRSHRGLECLLVSDPDIMLIDAERIRSVFQHAPLTLFVTVLNSVLTVVVLAPVADRGLLAIWTVLIVTVSAGRWAMRQVFLRHPAEGARPHLWAILSVVGSLTTGALWGVGATALSPTIEMYRLFLAFVVGGMCAGATTVNSAHFPTVLAFIVPASLPLAASFLAQGSTPELVSALMIVVFASALSLTSWRAHRAFGERVRLQLALRRQQHELSEANEQLRKEIAERQNVEATLQQAQKMEAIGHLTGGIAHDFNNLLHVVLGNMDLIRRLSGDGTRIFNCASAARLAAERGARLTSSLLAFARRQTLQAERVNLNTELTAFQPILLQALGGAIHFESVFMPDLPVCHIDPAHFHSSILNLVINARDAMSDGGRLSISTRVVMLEKEDLLENLDATPGRFVAVSVQDSGSGMSEEVLARVFEPFFTTKEIGKGSGLGLSQVFGFAHQSGGCVRLQSEQGAGTCATLLLPAAPDEVIEGSVE